MNNIERDELEAIKKHNTALLEATKSYEKIIRDLKLELSNCQCKNAVKVHNLENAILELREENIAKTETLRQLNKAIRRKNKLIYRLSHKPEKKHCDCEEYKAVIKNLNERYQDDCIEINRLNTTIDVLVEKLAR